MAKKPIEVETLTYDATRKNIPTEEYESIMREQDKTPIQLAYERRNRDLDPQLVWRGKDEQDWSDLIVQAPPLNIQEKVHPKVIFDDLKRESAIHSYLTYLRDRLAYSHRQPCKRPYPRSGFMHIDLGPAREWGERFAPHPTSFAAEAPPAREALSGSRSMAGSGTAGFATIGAAGIDVARETLGDKQSAIEPLIPYLDTLRWAFIALALAGIALTIYARLDDWKRGRR